MAVRSVVTGKKELAEFFREFPSRVQNRIARHAVKKAGKALAVRAKTLTPWTKNKSEKQRAKRPWNSKDFYIAVSRNKPMVARTIVGIQSYKSPHKHLFEFGTNGRWTQHGSPQRQYRKVAMESTYFKNERYKTADGRTRTRKVLVKMQPQWRSAGSTLRRKGDIKGKGAGVVALMKWRGRMPEYRPLTKAFQQMEQVMLRIIEDECRKGLQRAVARTATESVE